MIKQPMSIYFDLSLWIRFRINTGIQRVLKEIIQRSLKSPNQNIDYYYLLFDLDSKKIMRISNTEMTAFIEDINNYQFSKTTEFFELEKKQDGIAIFFDLDAAWNGFPKRHHLYPQLKHNNFYIFNFLYDLSPVILPQFCDENTCRNFVTYLSAIYSYSDMIFFDSASAEQDFISIKSQINVHREIATRVTGLGADYILPDTPVANSFQYQYLLEKKYLLFVGTIEPRKNQKSVLNAFSQIAKRYPELNLIFIGRQGWKVNRLVEQINRHPLKDKNIYWLNNIDDTSLSQFYQHAWMVIYLSKHEGYGLPIAESLRYGNITIASKNSSMYEVGRNFSDYVVFNSENEIIDLVALYYDNKTLYQLKKQYIQKHYQSLKWDSIYQSINTIYDFLPISLEQNKQHLKQLQLVFISIDIDTLQGTIDAFDKFANFVKEYIVVTNKEVFHLAEQLSSKRAIRLIDEAQILGSYAKDFKQRDHQKKNWLLRASLLNIDDLDCEFIMLDDDNRPLKTISLDFFISPKGRYNAYYYHDILNWNHYASAYDQGQQNLKELLSSKGLELLSYSSHAPQIINKAIFAEVVDIFFQTGLDLAIDEWSIYFNYALSKYPFLFHKKVFKTLNWPATPADWQHQYVPIDYSFENYYPAIYASHSSHLNQSQFFLNSMNLEEKCSIKTRQYQPYFKTKQIFNQYRHYLAYKNLIYGSLSFETENLSCYLFSIPKRIICISESIFRLTSNIKMINHRQERQKIQLYYWINGHMGHHIEWTTGTETYDEMIIELPISTYSMRRRHSLLLLDIKIDGQPVYGKKSPYSIKLSQYKYTHKVRIPQVPDKSYMLESEPLKVSFFIRETLRKLFAIGYKFRKKVLKNNE